MEHLQLVRNTYNNKTKIKEVSQLKNICKYLNASKLNTFQICFGNNILIDLFELDLVMLKKISIRPETIFKINLLIIKLKLLKYCNGSKFELSFEEPSTIERNIHKIQNHYKHDAIIQIYSNTKFCEVGLEYNEKKSHCNTRQINNDNSRNINSKMFLDLYCVYNESNDNYEEFMKKLIYDLIVIICTVNKDEYFLAKILFLKEQKLNLRDEEFFDMIINWKKTNKIDLQEFHDLISPKDDEGNDYSLDEYMEHLEELQIKVDNYICDYNNFVKLIINESNACSERIIELRKIQSNVADKLFCATKEIINLMEKVNEKKGLIIPYTEEIIKNLHILNNKKIVEIGINNYNKMYN